MTKEKGMFVLTCVLITLLLISSVYALTGSMGNARMILYPEVNGWFTTTIEKSILVKNVNEVPINITLEADEKGKEFLEVIDNSFILQPNTEKNAQFVVKVKKEGTYEGRINVFFSSQEEGQGPGVVLSSTIIVVAKKDQGYEEIDEEENQTVDVITGEVSMGIEDDKKSKGIMFLSISSFFLLVVLAFLVFLMNKSKKSKKKK